MITVVSPDVIEFGGPIASSIVSPILPAGRLFIITVADPVILTPGPCGGTGDGTAQVWISAPAAAPVIALDIEASAADLAACSAAAAAGAPGVPAAAAVAATAVWIAVSAAALADCKAATAASGMPRHAGANPIKTFGLPGPGDSVGGKPCAVVSINALAAGPVGISSSDEI